MGNSGPRDLPSSIPEKIRYLFEIADISRVFEFMEQRYHLHPDWHKQFKEDLKRQQKDMPDQEYFFIWATAHLNPALQILVRRKANIIHDIATYLLKKRIDEREREANEKRNFYRNGSWKTELNKM